MPPKKAKGGKSKSKDKKGAKTKEPPKMSKKEKKLRAKFGHVIAEGTDGKEVAAVTFRRDELEWAVERTREQVTLNRSERIRYQLERDFLFELQEQYRKKLECLILEQEALIAKNNRAAQDAEENKLIKAMEGKHFRAETQIAATQQSVRDEIRKKKIQDLLEQTWRYMSMDLDELDALMAKNAGDYKKRIRDTQKKLQDLHKYMEDHDKQLEEYIKNLEQEKKNSLELFFVIRRMENQLSEERWNECIWKLSSNFEKSLKAMKDFYNDASFSNFTMMYTLQDMITSSVVRMEQYSQKIRELQKMMQEAHSQMPLLRITFGKARVRHDRIVRTKQGIKTVNKELQLTKNKTNGLRVDYRQNFHRLENINAERENFRTSGAEMVQNVLDSYTNRFQIIEEQKKMQQAVDKKEKLKECLRTHFKDPNNFSAIVDKFKDRATEKEEMVERYHLRALQARKQTQNLRDSLESRLKKVGLTRKHATVTPKLPPIQGRPNWGPANLVAGNSYPIREHGLTGSAWDASGFSSEMNEEFQTAVPVCMTQSIRDFLKTKQQQAEQKWYLKRLYKRS